MRGGLVSGSPLQLSQSIASACGLKAVVRISHRLAQVIVKRECSLIRLAGLSHFAQAGVDIADAAVSASCFALQTCITRILFGEAIIEGQNVFQ